MFTQKFIKIFHSVQEIGLFSLFQNLALGKVSTNDKCHFANSWTRCRQYQCVCKILSKYSKRFKSYLHFSRTGRWQNLHKQSGDKIKCLIIGHTMKVNLQFQLTFLGSVQFGMSISNELRYWIFVRWWGWCVDYEINLMFLFAVGVKPESKWVWFTNP